MQSGHLRTYVVELAVLAVLVIALIVDRTVVAEPVADQAPSTHPANRLSEWLRVPDRSDLPAAVLPRVHSDTDVYDRSGVASPATHVVQPFNSGSESALVPGRIVGPANDNGIVIVDASQVKSIVTHTEQRTMTRQDETGQAQTFAVPYRIHRPVTSNDACFPRSAG